MDSLLAVRLGYDARDLARAVELAGGTLDAPAHVGAVLDRLEYRYDWQTSYEVRSVKSALHATRIACIDAAVLAYGLLEWIPGVERCMVALHRRDPNTDEECGHVVAAFRTAVGWGAFSKSSFAGFGHRAPVHRDPTAIARSFADSYLAMGFRPLYFGVTTLEQAAPDLDWRLSPRSLDELSSRLQRSYAYAFETPETWRPA